MPTPSSLLLALATLQGAHAWGELGHATIAYIAQNYVSDTTASWAQNILDDTSDSYLASIASWADDYRYTTAGAYSEPYHYIDAEDNPPTTCDVDYDRDCTADGCSISAIANYTQRVTDGRLTADHTQEALKFLVHFLGDITQPLHDEALDVGGNEITVTFDGYTDDNLHSDWDTYIPEKKAGDFSLANAQAWADALVTEIESGNYSGSVAAGWIADDSLDDVVTTATAWAADANAYVCTVVMPDGVAALEDAADLYPDYYNSAIPTVELQIAKGGYRLANWLNMIVDTDAKRKRDEADGVLPSRKRALPDLTGADLLPAPRPLSRAQLARAASGGCRDHKH